MTPPTSHSPIGRSPSPTDAPEHHPVPYGQSPSGPPSRIHNAELVQVRRDLFWQNVVREVLMGLAAAAAADAGRLDATATAAANSTTPVSDMFDGRVGVITVQGQRIPVADVVPVFACSDPCGENNRGLSSDIQCTVFRIRTPSGESYTLPITQIVGVHSVSSTVAEQLEAAAQKMEETDADGNKMPFGFAAYTSLAKAESQGGADDTAESAAQAGDKAGDKPSVDGNA